jgi:outer membrane protein assembly factor BamB
MRPQRDNRGIYLAVSTLLLIGGWVEASDWPRFRGPNGTGIAADKGVPVKWTAGQGVLWKTAISGVGHSSPVISGGHVFLQSSVADGKERLLICLDAVNGKTLWTANAPGSKAKTHPKNSLASSTPAIDGDRVFAAFWDGKDIHLCAYDFKGTLLWQQNLGGYTSQHGVGHSPIVVDGKVLFANDQDGAARLVAFDAATGKLVWGHERKPFRACYSTPFVHTREGGDKEVIVASTAGITGYNPSTGTENWSYTWSFTKAPLRTVASPIEANGLVFATSGDGAGDRHLIAVKYGGQGDVTGTNLVWEDRKFFPYVPCMLAWGDHLYSVTDKGIAMCHVAATGKEVWRQRLADGFTASPILVDGKVYAAAEDGTVYVFAAAPEFKLLAKSPVGEPVYASPAVADNHLFIRGKNHLFCIGKTTGK